MEGTESLSARVEQNNITTTLGAKHLYDYTSHTKTITVTQVAFSWLVIQWDLAVIKAAFVFCVVYQFWDN